MILRDLTPYLLYNFKSESELIGSIQKISQNFTVNRDKLGDYLKDEKLVSAYTAFYLTTNIPKWSEVLKKIKLEQGELKDFEIVDIGAGPGTFTLAQLKHNPEQVIYALETSELMRNQATKIIKGIYPKSIVSICAAQREIPKKLKPRIGVFGHSANEMLTDQVISLIEKLELDQVIFIEPGTKAYFEKALEIRARLLQSHFGISYPCSAQSSCPISEQNDWCHQFLYIKQHPEIERICQIVKKDRKLLPQTIHYFKRKEEVRNENIQRVIRVYKPTKFGLEMQICHSENNENKVFDLQQLSRNRSRSQMKSLQKILAGDEIKFNLIRELENNKVRGDIEILD